MARQDTPTESFSVVVTASARLGASSVDDSVKSALTHFLEQSKAYDAQLEFSFAPPETAARIQELESMVGDQVDDWAEARDLVRQLNASLIADDIQLVDAQEAAIKLAEMFLDGQEGS